MCLHDILYMYTISVSGYFCSQQLFRLEMLHACGIYCDFNLYGQPHMHSDLFDHKAQAEMSRIFSPENTLNLCLSHTHTHLEKF